MRIRRVAPRLLGTILPTLMVLVGVAACGTPDALDDPRLSGEDSVQVIRTGNPTVRGYSDSDFPRVQEIAEGVYAYEQLRSAGDERFTTVSMFVVTEAGVLVADGQGSVEETQRLIDTISEITSQPITHVVVCSDHGDHTAGNSAFPPGATFIAHPTSQAVLAASAADVDRADDAPLVVVPTETVDDRRSFQLGSKKIEILFLGRAHTGGDLHVYLPEDKILFMSEAYLNRIFPAMRSAYPSEWVATLAKAQAMDVDMYVPGHGFVDHPTVLEEELETFRRAALAVMDEAKRLHASGLEADVAIEQAAFGDLESWTLRASQGPTAIRRIYMELNGELPNAR